MLALLYLIRYSDYRKKEVTRTKEIKKEIKKMKRIATIDLREDKTKEAAEEGRVLITIAGDNSIYLSTEAGPNYRRIYDDCYVQVYHDRFISFDSEHDYNFWIKETVRDYLFEKGIIYTSDFGELKISLEKVRG